MTKVFVYEDVTAAWAGGDIGSRPAPSLLAEGQAMLAAVTVDFRRVSGLDVLPWRQSTASAAGRTTSEIPTTTVSALAPLAAAESEFCHHVRAAEYSLVIAPECGGRLEHLCREVVRAGGQLLGTSPDAVRLTTDKLALAKHWKAHGVVSPATWSLGQEPAGLPVVVKPRDGAGSQATVLLAGGEMQTDESPGPMIAQEYVPGFAASVAFLIGPNSRTPLIPCQQLLSDDGRFSYLGGRLPIAPELAIRAIGIATAAVACVPGLLGYVGVDVVLGQDGRDWAIEINPRLTTSYVGLRALARFNLAEAMLATVRGESLPMEWNAGPIEFTPDGRLSPAA